MKTIVSRINVQRRFHQLIGLTIFGLTGMLFTPSLAWATSPPPPTILIKCNNDQFEIEIDDFYDINNACQLDLEPAKEVLQRLYEAEIWRPLPGRSAFIEVSTPQRQAEISQISPDLLSCLYTHYRIAGDWIIGAMVSRPYCSYWGGLVIGGRGASPPRFNLWAFASYVWGKPSLPGIFYLGLPILAFGGWLLLWRAIFPTPPRYKYLIMSLPYGGAFYGLVLAESNSLSVIGGLISASALLAYLLHLVRLSNFKLNGWALLAVALSPIILVLGIMLSVILGILVW